MVSIRVALHLVARAICYVKNQESSLVLELNGEISPNPFTPRSQANLVVRIFYLKKT